MKKRAFTLVELMVVLAIVALLSSIIFGAISSVREGNKRGSCQGNLNQIYAAARLYGQDNDGQFPYLNSDLSKLPISRSNIIDDSANTQSKVPFGGAGLWSLYVYVPQLASGDIYGLPLSSNDIVFPASTATDKRPAGVLASYIKSPRALHCPSDSNFDALVTYGAVGTATATQTVSTGESEFTGSDGRRHINPFYLSYQSIDDTINLPTYSSFRKSGVKRQMRYFEQSTTSASTVNLPDRRSPDQTIMTWCRFHRSLDSNRTTKASDFSRTFDNVLFLDGSVQSVPVEQTVTLVGGSTSAVCRGWKRVPLAEANAVPKYVIDECNASP